MKKTERDPGVGKSTFAREFCRRWERGEMAWQYQLVLLLSLMIYRCREYTRQQKFATQTEPSWTRWLPRKESRCQSVCHELLHSHHLHTHDHSGGV